MIAHLIRWSVRNRFFVVLGMLALVGAGLWAVRSTPIDALPGPPRNAKMRSATFTTTSPSQGSSSHAPGLLSA